MKTLLSAFLLLALAAPGAHAQDTHTTDCDACNSVADAYSIVAITGPVAFLDAIATPPNDLGSDFADPVFHPAPHRTFILLDPDQALTIDLPREVHPTTQPILDFTHGRRWVHVSGVALADGQPVPGAKVNVIAELDGDFNKYELAVADTRGVYNTWFQAPAAIRSVTVDVQSSCSTGNEADCMTFGATASGMDSW